MDHEWRCISYWTWGYSGYAMLGNTRGYRKNQSKNVKEKVKLPLCSNPFYSFGVGFGYLNTFSQGVGRMTGVGGVPLKSDDWRVPTTLHKAFGGCWKNSGLKGFRYMKLSTYSKAMCDIHLFKFSRHQLFQEKLESTHLSSVKPKWIPPNDISICKLNQPEPRSF